MTCADVEVTVALATLRAALYAMDETLPEGPRLTDEPRQVLVASMPGEPHGLSAAIDGETLRLAGWDVTEAIAPTIGDLQCRLGARHYDALDLSLSCVHRREHWLPRLADAIDRARRASRNPNLAVIVRGRLFTEEPERWRTVGADGGCASATQLTQTIGAALRRVDVVGRAAARRRESSRATRSRRLSAKQATPDGQHRRCTGHGTECRFAGF